MSMSAAYGQNESSDLTCWYITFGLEYSQSHIGTIGRTICTRNGPPFGSCLCGIYFNALK